MSYKVRSKDGRDVLCTYKAVPDDTMPVVGFIGAEALELSDGSDMRPVVFASFRAALRCASLHGGEVESPAIPLPCEPIMRVSVNGGW